MKKQRHVHMKPSDGKFGLRRDGQMFGGARRRENILVVLLSVIREYPGEYEIFDSETGKTLLEYVVDQPTWNDGKPEPKPWQPQHAWAAGAFVPGDEEDKEFIFGGFHRGNTWNGWKDPWFERPELERLIKMASETDNYKFTWIQDILIVEDENLQSVTVYEPSQVYINGVERTLWNLFGSGYFTWDCA